MPGNIRIPKSSRAVAGLNITHQNNFASQLIGKLKQETMYGAVKLHFKKDGLILQGVRELEYEQGKYIARAFLRAGIKGLTLKDILSRDEFEDISILIREAEMDHVEPPARLKVSKSSAIQEVFELGEGEAAGRGLPGFFKHYTDHSGYEAISRSRTLKAMPHSKNGRVTEQIYVTPLSLSPGEVHELLNMSAPQLRDRGMFVISFDIFDPALAARIRKNGIEMTLPEDISFDDQRIKIRYHGPNPLSVAA